ncbi:alpha/beta fold hydrolase [Knoellia sp. Soil729]|uniref:alpha/beta fold hydrolase n=1 Tax=Knoellia sp. Soil729 TaxID=1736394 RepID=UPI0006FFC496|nr:alpha/beta fold hydrolase [Knoellia sp. Soil729]KRE41272.1 alpha/beta hydrolase [Knoellia sp. Soil729]
MSSRGRAPLLAHDDRGSGPAVVLLHSGVTDRGMWTPVMPALSNARRVIAPDLRGFGETPVPGGPYADADDVVHLLDALGVGRAAFVGASFGGRVALEVAARHPDRVSSLVLLCTAYRGLEVTDPVVQAFGEREEELIEAGDVDGAVALNVATWVGPQASEQARADVARMQRRAFEVQLAADALDPPPQPERVEVEPGSIHVPTLVVSGALDVAHHRDIATLLAREIDGAELVELDWAGHLPSVERPDETAALVLEHLDREGVRPTG